MERQLQERLIGATVLMIVAVLVVPELLSGPKPDASLPEAVARDSSVVESPTVLAGVAETPLATAPRPDPTLASVSPSIAPALPPPVVVPPATPVTPPAMIAPPAVRPQVTAPPAAVAPSKPAAVAAATPKSNAPPTKPAPGKGGWSVQVASYAKLATAQRMAKDLQKQGLAAVVLPVDLQGKRLYRVRVGAPTDRKTADQTLRQVQRLMPGTSPAVVR